MKKVSHTHSYEQSVDEIGATYLDPDFLTGKYEGVGARKISVEVEAYEGDEFKVTTTRDVPAEVPRALKSVVNPWNRMVTTETWHGPNGGPYIGSAVAVMKGAPITLHADVTITENGSGCTVETITSIDCAVPIIGRQLAKFIGKEAIKSLDDEADYISSAA